MLQHSILLNDWTRRMTAMAILILAFAGGCRKVGDVVAPGDTQDVTIHTSIAGQVVDESGQPLAGVQISGYGASIMTDANGLFAMPNVAVPKSRAVVLAKKANYFDGARGATPSANGTTYMQIMLAANSLAGTINAASGGTVTLTNGASVKLPANGVVTATGAAYNGPVSVNAKYLNPLNANFDKLFPGDLKAMRSDSSYTQLFSYGVIMAELHGASGEILQPAPGKPATLTMPVPSTRTTTAPTSLPLWFFDEAIGMWKEDGSATMVGTSYVGTVTHFSSWNCDWSGPWGTIHGMILCNDIPIPNVSVALTTDGYPTVVTDANGEFTARVPADARIPIAIEVRASGNGGLYYTASSTPVTVVPNATTEVGSIVLSSPCPSALKGTLTECSDKPIGGMVVANWNGGMAYCYTTTGTFKMIVPAGTLLTFTATASNGEVAQPQQFTSGTMGTSMAGPTIVACPGKSDVLLDISGSFDGSAMAFSQDGSKLATLMANATDVAIIDVATGNLLVTIPNVFSTQSQYPTKLLSFSPDGSKLLSYGSYGLYYYSPGLYLPSGYFDCWSSNGTRLTAATKSGHSAIFSPDSKSILYTTPIDSSAPGAPNVMKYDIATATATGLLTTNTDCYLAGYAAGGTQLVMLSSDISIWPYKSNFCTWDIATNKAIVSIPFAPTPRDSGSSTNTLQASADGKILGLVLAGSMHFYDMLLGSEISTSTIRPSFNSVFGISSQDRSYIGQYRSGPGNTVALYNLTDGISTRVFDPSATAGYSTGVAISADGTKAAAVYGNSIRVWKVK